MIYTKGIAQTCETSRQPMEPNLRKLLITAVAYLINTAIGTAVAIRENLPAEFAGRRTGKDARSDFIIGMGTALSPPLIACLIHALFVLLTLRPRRLQTIGITGLTLNGTFFTIGMCGEPITYKVLNPRTFDPAKTIIVAANLILPLLTSILGLQELARRRHT